jgi:hypothetical protein
MRRFITRPPEEVRRYFGGFAEGQIIAAVKGGTNC